MDDAGSRQQSSQTQCMVMRWLQSTIESLPLVRKYWNEIEITLCGILCSSSTFCDTLETLLYTVL